MENLSTISQYLKCSLFNNQAIMIIAQGKLRKTVSSEMSTFNIDIAYLKNKNQIKFYDAEFLLLSHQFDNEYDVQSLNAHLSQIIQKQKLEYNKILVIDEMVDLALKQDNRNFAFDLKKQLEDIASQHDISILMCNADSDIISAANNSNSIMASIEDKIINTLETAGDTLANLADSSSVSNKMKSF